MTTTQTKIDGKKIARVLRLFNSCIERWRLDIMEEENLCFLLAEECGWNWEDDTDFMESICKASPKEISIKGKSRFLEFVVRLHELDKLNQKLTAKGFEPLNSEQERIYLSFSHDDGQERIDMLADIDARLL
jgi:hypothetical protein